MNTLEKKINRHERRKAHIRLSISGTAERPRISVFRSNSHLYGQVIDDVKGVTLCSVSNLQSEYKKLKNTTPDAEKLGEALGKKMSDLKIKEAVFDRNGYLYHGIVKSFADGIRKQGVKF